MIIRGSSSWDEGWPGRPDGIDWIFPPSKRMVATLAWSDSSPGVAGLIAWRNADRRVGSTRARHARGAKESDEFLLCEFLADFRSAQARHRF
jgi:hypothetical protein